MTRTTSTRPVWRQKDRKLDDGYTRYPNPATRPHCDGCGPFRSRDLRVKTQDEFGAVYQCRGCDNEETQ